MGYDDEMRMHRAGEAAAYHQYLLNRPKYDVHSFVEGRDDKCFYRAAIKQVLDIKVMCADPLPCGGRSGVALARAKIEAYEHTNFGHKSGKVRLYFVDRDIVEFVNKSYTLSEDIFVTAMYSFESYLVSSEVVREYLGDCLHSSDDADMSYEYDNICEKFNHLVTAFLENMLLVMSWCVAAKRKDVKIDFDLLSINRLVEIDSNLQFRMKLIGLEQVVAELPLILRVSEQITRDEINDAQRDLSGSQPRSWVRGKQLLHLQVKFIDCVVKIFSVRKFKHKCAGQAV
jgi:hypothetical protein